MSFATLPDLILEPLVKSALMEDLGSYGDVTTRAVIPEDVTYSARLRARDWRVFYPGHGAAVTAPQERLDWLIHHRKGREAEILACLAQAPATPAELARAIYQETPAALLPAAERNVFAHLVDLAGRSIVEPCGAFTETGSFQILA